VATFFATTSRNSKDRILYVLRRYDFPTADEDASPYDIHSSDVPTEAMAIRITAQSGVFTVHPQPAAAFQHDVLKRWIIKNDAVIEISITLHGYGFNAAPVFPWMGWPFM
jgi:hypothetical protein